MTQALGGVCLFQIGCSRKYRGFRRGAELPGQTADGSEMLKAVAFGLASLKGGVAWSDFHINIITLIAILGID